MAGLDHPDRRIHADEASSWPALARGAKQSARAAADVKDRLGFAEARRESESSTVHAIEVESLPLRAVVPRGPAIELADVVVVRRSLLHGALEGHGVYGRGGELRRDAGGE
jgi:hypothetical protein